MSGFNIAVAGTESVGRSVAILPAGHNQVAAEDIVPEKVDLINQRRSPLKSKQQINLGGKI